MSSTHYSGKGPLGGNAKHGPRTEVNWEGGSGRQPYGNQGEEEAEAPNVENETMPGGDRGERSGRNVEQLEKSRGTP